MQQSKRDKLLEISLKNINIEIEIDSMVVLSCGETCNINTKRSLNRNSTSLKEP